MIPQTEFAVHKALCPRIVIIYPGLNATQDGESPHFTQAHPHRYRLLAERLQATGVAAVLRLANPGIGYTGGGQAGVDRLAQAIDYSLAHDKELCGHRSPELCLMGFSAGGGAAAALAGKYQPRRMLLIALPGDAGGFRIVLGLKKYTGELVILGGERDEIVGAQAVRLFDDMSPAAQPKRAVIVPECDHCFTRADHNQLLEDTAVRLFAGLDSEGRFGSATRSAQDVQ